MRSGRRRCLASLALALSIAIPSFAAIKEYSTPAGAHSSDPFLAMSKDGSILMSWLERVGDNRAALKIASWRDGKWSPARTVMESDQLVVNWADAPSVVSDRGGALFAQWLESRGGEASDVKMSISLDGGRTWGAPFLLNDDGKRVEHGFVSFVPLPAGGVGALWLDGRNMEEGSEEGEMMLRYAEVSAKGGASSSVLVAQRVCECCNTAMALAVNGLVAAYRDRSPTEVRDISVVRRINGKWSAPKAVSSDQWKISGCPVNGPQLDVRGSQVVVAWFTAANDVSAVKAAFSKDGGTTFALPVRVSGGATTGRVEVTLLDDGSARLFWMETFQGKPSLMTRRIFADGRTMPAAVVGQVSGARSSGFPRAVQSNGRTYVAWTDDVELRIRFAELN